jgi:type II secretory pathway pseudopilin PulG
MMGFTLIEMLTTTVVSFLILGCLVSLAFHTLLSFKKSAQMMSEQTDLEMASLALIRLAKDSSNLTLLQNNHGFSCNFHGRKVIVILDRGKRLFIRNLLPPIRLDEMDFIIQGDELWGKLSVGKTEKYFEVLHR